MSRDKNKIKDISVYITRLINKNTGGLYMDRNPVSHRPEIFISNKTMSGDSEDAIIILKHEIGHAVQQYKKVSPDYSRETSKKNFEPNSVYYTEPAELQIQEMDIMNMFNQMLNRIKLKGKKYYEYYIPIFKRAINSILKKDWTSVEKSLLPQPLYIRQHFLDTLSQHPKYMRAFKLRLYNYIQNIPNEFPE